MISHQVVFAPRVDPLAKPCMRCATLAAMVKEGLLDKSPGFPSLGPRTQHSDQIDSAGFDGRIPADFIETLTAKHLAHPGHMFGAYEFIVVRQIAFPKCCSGDAQPGILGESVHQKLEIIGFERNVGVQIADDAVVETVQSLAPRVNGVRFAGKATLPALRHSDKLDPRIRGDVALDDLGSAVGRSVVNDHPLEGPSRLRNYRLDRE